MVEDLIKSPFYPSKIEDLPTVNGINLITGYSHIKELGPDVGIVVFDNLSSVAGVFTNSEMASAPVAWCRSIIQEGKAKALIVNSGNANAFTGNQGSKNVIAKTAALAKAIKCRADEIFVASTGVIGEQLPIQNILDKIPDLIKGLRKNDWLNLAQSIRTTDTYPKLGSLKFTIDEDEFVLNGVAKGSGMINPNMGTLLGFFFTDACIPANILSYYLNEINSKTFNAITVDGDTSTSDTILLFSTGNENSHKKISDVNDPRLDNFISVLNRLMKDLAHQVIKDGEGVSKFITITVENAITRDSARKIANKIANSPLVKTAIAGEDPNWGRIIMAIGNAKQKIDKNKLKIYFGEILIAENGSVSESYCENQAAIYMKNNEILIRVDLGLGSEEFTAWTCDFTKQYIQINSDYRS